MVGGAAAVARREIARGRVGAIRGGGAAVKLRNPWTKEKHRGGDKNTDTQRRRRLVALCRRGTATKGGTHSSSVVVVHAHGGYTISSIRHTKHKKAAH